MADLTGPVGLLSGLLRGAASQARQVPETLLRLPVTALGQALVAAEALRRRTSSTRSDLAGSGDVPPAARQTARAADEAAAEVRDAVEKARAAAVDVAEQAAPADEAPSATRPSGGRTSGDSSRPRTAAGGSSGPGRSPRRTAADANSAAPKEAHDRAAELVEELTDGVPDDRETLPLPDLPTMSLGQLRGKLRVLDVQELATLLEYERGHGNRLPFITMMENRIAKVSAEQQSERSLPSGGSASGAGRGGTGGGRSGAKGARSVAGDGGQPSVEEQVDEAAQVPSEQLPPATPDAEDGADDAGAGEATRTGS